MAATSLCKPQELEDTNSPYDSTCTLSCTHFLGNVVAVNCPSPSRSVLWINSPVLKWPDSQSSRRITPGRILDLGLDQISVPWLAILQIVAAPTSWICGNTACRVAECPSGRRESRLLTWGYEDCNSGFQHLTYRSLSCWRVCRKLLSWINVKKPSKAVSHFTCFRVFISKLDFCGDFFRCRLFSDVLPTIFYSCVVLLFPTSRVTLGSCGKVWVLRYSYWKWDLPFRVLW